MKWVSPAIFFSGNRQEVNSTWFPEIGEPIKSREKQYSLVLCILTCGSDQKTLTRDIAAFSTLTYDPWMFTCGS